MESWANPAILISGACLGGLAIPRQASHVFWIPTQLGRGGAISGLFLDGGGGRGGTQILSQESTVGQMWGSCPLSLMLLFLRCLSNLS